MTNPFTEEIIDLLNGNELCVIDIKDINNDFKNFIDNTFVKICEGASGNNLQTVKERLISFLDTKRGTNIEMGAIAEFLLHLYLNFHEYKQQFLYFNLEENSIKKGFDGYYRKANEEWILESKSGDITTAGINHIRKIKESYNDLKDKLAGGSTNNPWRNAYNHASHIDVGAEISLRTIIKKFDTEYVKGITHDIKDFNIIPGSTIFLNGSWVITDANLETDVKALITTLSFKRIKILCITKRSITLFWTYLTNP